ncbi:MAG: N-acetylglucosamine-6-phosphate deacetylase [Frankiales bacterium]|nr:N-acetylglucosamine-6-phosphate deacetylase [Frankiales bacterium]
MPIISAPRMLVEGQLSGPASLVVEGGTIVDVVEGLVDGDCLRLEHGLLTPGLIDLQINGYYGVDFVDASTEEWVAVASRLPETGVTAFQPTFITAPVERLLVGMQHASAALPTLTATPGAARVLGVHLEGPFLSPRQAGVHDISFMHPATPEDLDALLAPGVVEWISMVTLAPELPGALDAIRRLRTHGVVVSIGHSDARGTEVEAAVEAGARMVTHIFNAQRGLGHREPGVAGQALADPRLTVGLIADLHHVAPEICTVVMQAARGRVALVTDAVAAAGMPPGSYELGGQQIRISPGEGLARRTDGTIAGSSLALDVAVRNLVDVGIAASDVLDAATRVPADVLGRTDLGRLATGAKADLVWWSDDLRPLRVWIGGQVAFDATSVPA